MQGKLIENTLAYKFKQIFFVLLKLIVLIGAFYLIYIKLFKNEALSITNFKYAVLNSELLTLKSLSLLLGLTVANWCFEILKWQELAKLLKPIGFLESFKQCLFSLTASLITPNRIGDYGAKALFFSKKNLKKCVALNVLGHMSQLAITLTAGIFGVLHLIKHYSFEIVLSSTQQIILIGSIILCFLVFVWLIFKKKQFLKNNLFNRSLIFKTLGFSALRYLMFSIQFYVLLQVFNFNISFSEALAFTSSMYLLASIIPAISLFDVVIKGSISVYLFALLGFNPIPILSIVLIMWLLNFALPALIGSYFVITFKPKFT